MIIKKCTFNELPDVMQMSVMRNYSKNCADIPVSEYRLAIWSKQNTLYYNNLKESEVERFIALIESEKRFLNGRTRDSIYNKYGFAVYMEIHNAHEFFLKNADKALAEKIVQEYMPIIEKAMEKPSIPLNHSLLEAMSKAADKGKFKFKEWSTVDAYIYFMGYLLGSGKLKWEEQLL